MENLWRDDEAEKVVASYAAKGVNRETCDEVLQKITALYREMAQQYGCGVKAIRK